jgi:hypothetical protein
MASVWFLATGAKLLRGPDLPEWGPPRTFDRAGEVAGVDLDKVAPFPKGGREDIFGWPQPGEEEEAGARRERERERRRIEFERKRQAGDDDGGGRRPGVTTGDVKDTSKGRRRGVVSRARVPPRFVGTLRVEDSGTYTFVAEGDEYVAIAPGGGEAGRYRLVSRTETCIVLRDTSGRLHRVPVP